jgi:hypothetical protein
MTLTNMRQLGLDQGQEPERRRIRKALMETLECTS